MALDASQIKFEVRTEELRQAGRQIEAHTAGLQKQLEEMQHTVQMTAGCWEGEGGNLCRDAFRSFRDEMETLVARLRENVTDLETIAGVYEDSEAAAGQMAEELPDNLIV